MNFNNPFDRTDYSNLFNNIRFSPLPWVSFSVNSQLPAFDKGFTEVGRMVAKIQRMANLQLTVAYCYLTQFLFPGQ